MVLGGGGVAGIAWTVGLLAGLAESGRDVTGADLIIGTSAGSVVAAQLGSGLGFDEMFARQVDPALQAKEIPADLDFDKFIEFEGRLLELAAAAKTVPEAERRAVIASRLPTHTWSSRDIRLVAVDLETGEPRVFDRNSGVDLVDAVAASCAVPGVWPPVTIDGRRYVDGGVRSIENADYAAGAARIVIVAPMGVDLPMPVERPLRVVVEELRAGGAEVVVIAPDEASVAAIGTNPLDPGTRVPAAQAGRAQGKATQGV